MLLAWQLLAVPNLEVLAHQQTYRYTTRVLSSASSRSVSSVDQRLRALREWSPQQQQQQEEKDLLLLQQTPSRSVLEFLGESATTYSNGTSDNVTADIVQNESIGDLSQPDSIESHGGAVSNSASILPTFALVPKVVNNPFFDVR